MSDIASSAQTMQADSTAGVGYSDTNIRQDGVGEGDIAKTDGERLYILNNQTIEIVGIGQETVSYTHLEMRTKRVRVTLH